MKFTIGTASSSMNFEEDLKLIKSSLLYADTIELIGMAEYAIYKYFQKCFDKSSPLKITVSPLLILKSTFILKVC